MQIEKLQLEHWKQVADIYLQGIATRMATFETLCPNWENWDKGHMQECRFVALANRQVNGWAALSPVSGRCVYAGVAEVSVYIHQNARGKGLGLKLLHKLVDESEKEGIWTLQAGIFPENVASIVIHEKTGFRKVGLREKLGKLDGHWKDVLLMERRSKVCGID